jgi:hypothetical protein
VCSGSVVFSHADKLHTPAWHDGAVAENARCVTSPSGRGAGQAILARVHTSVVQITSRAVVQWQSKPHRPLLSGTRSASTYLPHQRKLRAPFLKR